MNEGRVNLRTGAVTVVVMLSLWVIGEAHSDTDIDRRVQTILSTLTLEQKVAQMIQGEIKHVTPEDVREYGLGSVLNGGGSFPAQNKHASVKDWVDLADAYYLASVDTSQGKRWNPHHLGH